MSSCTIQLALTPEQALSRWPADLALAAIWSGGGRGGAAEGRSRWTILSAPSSVRAMAALNGLVGEVGRSHESGFFGGGQIVALSYDLGFDVEPAALRAAANRAEDDRQWPRVIAARCDDALVYDNVRGDWHGVGDWRRIADRLVREDARDFAAGPLVSGMGRERYERGVESALEHIRAGDVYQVNLAHRLSGTFRGSARGAFRALVAGAAPWYGGYLEFDDANTRRCVLSASPELLLSFDAQSRELLTRPMKGTRPGAVPAAELRESVKDRSELAMIVDLMRNDLGRVSESGSVRVLAARDVERHAGERSPLWQATATVSGRLRAGLGICDALRAVFPGGSVTGAPKIRAMRIIDELEPVARGVYCGSMGYIADSGDAAFNVAIRTALAAGRPTSGGSDQIEDGVLDFSVGAGIVADSVPELEWRETLAKAGVVRAIARVCEQD